MADACLACHLQGVMGNKVQRLLDQRRISLAFVNIPDNIPITHQLCFIW